MPKILIRNKELEQSHVCLGTSSYPQDHEDRYASYVLNTLLGGSMSSRLFQNVREKRGLAYAVFSGLSAYRDAGSFTIYAGCANEAVGEVMDLVVEELRSGEGEPVPEAELRRAKDHLKGSLMLESREHGEPHVAPRPAGDLLRSAVRSRRNARGCRAGHARGCAARRRRTVQRMLSPPCWQRERLRSRERLDSVFIQRFEPETTAEPVRVSQDAAGLSLGVRGVSLVVELR